MDNLSRRHALVTGGGPGISRAMALTTTGACLAAYLTDPHAMSTFDIFRSTAGAASHGLARHSARHSLVRARLRNAPRTSMQARCLFAGLPLLGIGLLLCHPGCSYGQDGCDGVSQTGPRPRSADTQRSWRDRGCQGPGALARDPPLRTYKRPTEAQRIVVACETPRSRTTKATPVAD